MELRAHSLFQQMHRLVLIRVNLQIIHCGAVYMIPVSYTHLRAHETVLDLVCRLLLEKKHIVHITRRYYRILTL